MANQAFIDWSVKLSQLVAGLKTGLGLISKDLPIYLNQYPVDPADTVDHMVLEPSAPVGVDGNYKLDGQFYYKKPQAAAAVELPANGDLTANTMMPIYDFVSEVMEIMQSDPNLNIEVSANTVGYSNTNGYFVAIITFKESGP